MTDLFPTTCAHCGQPLPDTSKPSRFAEFWAAYPARNNIKRDKAKAEKYYPKAMKIVSEDVLIGAAQAYAKTCDGYPVDAWRWLRDKGWTSETAVTEKPAVQGNAIKWWADLINSNRPLFCNPRDDVIKGVLSSGLVSPERLRERGIA